MSTQSALTIVGYAVGSYFGYPQAGAMIGAMVGGRIDQNSIHLRGPRLSDLTIQKSEEGAGIPVAFGAVRVAGNILQCTEKRQRAHDTSSGKGSGPKQTNYTYDVDVAVGLCAGPIVGVRRIWANSNLIYDVSGTANASALLASGRVAGNVKVYTGTEDQLPDPTLEAITGAGKTPAYRGQAYVVLSVLQLADFGNQLPNFTFEVVVSGSTAPFRQLSVGTLPQSWKTDTVPGLGRPVVYSVDDVVRVGGGSATFVYDLEGNYVGHEPKKPAEMVFPAIPDTYHPGTAGYIVGTLFDKNVVRCIDPLQSVIGGTFPTIWIVTAFGFKQGLDGVLPTGRQMVTCCLSADQHHIFVVTAPAGTYAGAPVDQWHLIEWDGSVSYLVREGPIAGGVGLSEYSFGPGNCPQMHGSSAMLESGLDVVWRVYGPGAGIYLYTVPANNGGTLTGGYVKSFAGINFGFPSYQSIFADNGVCIVVGGNKLATFTRMPGLEPSPVPVSDVVSALCLRSGLSESDIDVSGLSDTVHGYVVANQSAARGALDPLRQYSAFDVAEANGKLVFVRRGNPQIAQIPWDDLAAHESGDTPDPLYITQADETELPTVVTVVYPDPHTDYQVASQTARRNRLSTSGQLWPIAPANNVARIELAVAMSAAQASRVADTLLWDAFTARKSAKFAVGLKWASLKVSDPIQIIGPTASYNLRIVKIDESGLLRNIEALFEDSAIYQSAPAAGVGAGVPQQTVSLPGPTRLELLDIPIVRDADDDAGFYAALGRYLPGWRGATLFGSADAGASWGDVQTVANSATIGTTLGALGGWAGGNTFDETNSIAVQLPAGLELSGISTLAVLNGGNAAIVGNELIQFRDTALIGPQQYRISGLLRGRRGTEDAIAGHAAGERFVLLAGVAGLARVAGAVGDIGISRQYKAITAGASMDSAVPVEWANSARGLKPLSPVQIGAGRDAAGTVTIKWQRRTRVGGEWRDSVDASLGEAVEQYDVEVWTADGSTKLATKTQLSAPTVTLLAAELNGPSPLADLTITVRVWQVSATVGRGSKGEAVVTMPAQVPVSVVPDGSGGYIVTPQVPPSLTLFGESNGKLLAMGAHPSTLYYARTWASSDGLTWTQVGDDTTPTSKAMRTTANASATETVLPSGMVVGWQAGTIWSLSDSWYFYRGSDTAEPTKLGYGLLYPNAYPISISNDGTKLVAIALDLSGNLASLATATFGGFFVWHSTDAGATWSKKGALTLDYQGTPSPRILRKCTAGWLLVNPLLPWAGIWRTTDPDAVNGWSKVLTLTDWSLSGLPADAWNNTMFVTSLEKLGSTWYAYLVNTASSAIGQILESTDDGQSWSRTYTDTGYLFGRVRPVLVGSVPMYLETGGKRVLRKISGSWGIATTDLPAGANFDALGDPSALGTRALAKVVSGATATIYTTTNGANWSPTTGISYT